MKLSQTQIWNSFNQSSGFRRRLLRGLKMFGVHGVNLPNRFHLARLLSARHASTNLFVGGLSYDTNETLLKEAFEPQGKILLVKVICDHFTGKSKGYGFVQFISEDAASKALKETDGLLLDGRNIRVQYAYKS